MQLKSTPAKKVQAGLVHSKWLRVEQTLSAYPLKRSILFWALRNGKVKSFLLKRDGAAKGCRLIDRDDLDRFLQEEADKCAK